MDDAALRLCSELALTATVERSHCDTILRFLPGLHVTLFLHHFKEGAILKIFPIHPCFLILAFISTTLCIPT